MKKILLVIDMQNDFITGSLKNEEAERIIPFIQKKLQEYSKEDMIFTRDTHYDNYLTTQEGSKLPVEHCIKDTCGWQVTDKLDTNGCLVFDKKSFGSIELADYIRNEIKPDEIEIVGVCTDICVISNAIILKASMPEIKISVDARCCAGVTVESHNNAISAMKMCQVDIINEEA